MIWKPVWPSGWLNSRVPRKIVTPISRKTTDHIAKRRTGWSPECVTAFSIWQAELLVLGVDRVVGEVEVADLHAGAHAICPPLAWRKRQKSG